MNTRRKVEPTKNKLDLEKLEAENRILRTHLEFVRAKLKHSESKLVRNEKFLQMYVETTMDKAPGLLQFSLN